MGSLRYKSSVCCLIEIKMTKCTYFFLPGKKDALTTVISDFGNSHENGVPKHGAWPDIPPDTIWNWAVKIRGLDDNILAFVKLEMGEFVISVQDIFYLKS